MDGQIVASFRCGAASEPCVSVINVRVINIVPVCGAWIQNIGTVFSDVC